MALPDVPPCTSRFFISRTRPARASGILEVRATAPRACIERGHRTPSSKSEGGSMTTERLPITALIATIRGWPAAREAIRLIAPQLFPAGGEFIVADGSENSPPSEHELLDAGGPVRWI